VYHYVVNHSAYVFGYNIAAVLDKGVSPGGLGEVDACTWRTAVVDERF